MLRVYSTQVTGYVVRRQQLLSLVSWKSQRPVTQSSVLMFLLLMLVRKNLLVKITLVAMYWSLTRARPHREGTSVDRVFSSQPQ